MPLPNLHPVGVRGQWQSRVLLIVLFVVFVVLPAIDYGRAGTGFVVGLVLDVVLLASVYALSGTRRTLRVGFLLCGITLVASTVGLLTGAMVFRTIGLACFVVTLAYVAYAMVAELFRARTVDASTVCAAISGYLAVGLLWALLYALVVARDAAAVRGLASSGEFSSLLYFSFTTLTTLGYGDLVPVSSLARSLATLEAVVGQMYLAITIARLVGLAVASAGRPES